MFIKKIALNIMTSGTLDKLKLEDRRRLVFLNGLILISDFILLLFSLNAFKEGNTFLFIANTTAFACILGLFIFLRFSVQLTLGCHIFSIIGLLLFFYLAISGGSDNSGVLWLLSYPIIAIFLLGLRTGMIYSLVLIMGIAACLFIPNFNWANYSFSFELRIIGSYILMLTFAYVFESTRHNTQLELEKTTHDLFNQKKERDTILNNVKEGIFLLNKNLEIESNYSVALEMIFSEIMPGGKNILDLLRNKIPKKLISATEDYLKMFFDISKDEDLLIEINPLTSVEYNLMNTDGDFNVKHLEFSFNRIIEDQGELFILAIVRDTTEEVNLARRLQRAETKNNKQMETIFQVINVEPDLLEEFVNDTEAELKAINKTLKEDHFDYITTLANIYQSVHAMKGNSMLIGFDHLANKLHDIEDEIDNISKTNLRYNDILAFTIKLAEIQKEIDSIKESINKVISYQSKLNAQGKKENIFLLSMHRVIEKTSSTLGKEVIFETSDFDNSHIIKNNRRVMKEIFIQLARNAVSHGIESPEDRVLRNKKKVGKVFLRSKILNGEVKFEFGDDGKGIDFGKIKEKAKDNKKLQVNNIESLDTQGLLKLIFHPGFSTADNTSIAFGRGIGMNLILSKLKSINGKLRVSTKEGKGSTFIITVPK